jgi:hypothetical protein
VIERRGARVGESFKDNSLSAWNPRVVREDWNRMMARLESGESDGVWVYDVSRFTRKPRSPRCSHTTSRTRTPTEAVVNFATVVATADVVGRSRAGCRFRRIPVVVVTTKENEEGSECSTC